LNNMSYIQWSRGLMQKYSKITELNIRMVFVLVFYFPE